MSVFRIFNYILVKLSSMIMFNSDLIQTMIHFLFAIAILLLLSMTRHPASVFTARFQDCEFVYHVLAQVVTMLHLTPCSPVRVHCTRLHALRAKLNTHFPSHQNIFIKHKILSSGRMISAPTDGCQKSGCLSFVQRVMK